MNLYTAIGRIGKDAVVRVTGAGEAVAGWSLAVESGYGDKKQTLWFDCSLWGNRANKLAEYIKKGDRLGVVGELGEREHEGKVYKTLRVNDVTLLGDKRGGEEAKRQDAQRTSGGSLDSDEIPFRSPITRRSWSVL